VPVLPVRLWQPGALVFAATTPAEPDQRLRMLEQAADANWQWLPMMGNDFPLHEFVARGPVIAWTPHLSGVAVKLDHPVGSGTAVADVRFRFAPITVAALLIIALLVANLWTLWDLKRHMDAREVDARKVIASLPSASPGHLTFDSEAPHERLALAIYQYLDAQGGLREMSQSQLLAYYEKLVAKDERMRVHSAEGKLALGALAFLSRRSPSKIEQAARQALDGKGYDPELIQLTCRRIHQSLNDAGE
jgi:hypothetical protein